MAEASRSGERAHHRRGHRPVARADRRARTASVAAALHAADDRHVSQRRGRVRRRQSAVVRPRLRREDALGGCDRAARRWSVATRCRRRRGHAVAPEQRESDEGRSAARRARVLRRERPRVVGAAATRCAVCSVATRSSPRSTSRASSRAGRSTSGPRRCSATNTALLCRAVPADGAHRTREGAEEEEVRRREARRLHRRGDRRDRGPVRPRDAARRRAALVGRRERGRRGRPDGEGPAHRHRHDLLARGHGHGSLRRSGRCGSATRTAGASPGSSIAIRRTSPT